MEKETPRIIVYIIIFVVIAIVNIAFKKKKTNIVKGKAQRVQGASEEEPFFPDIKPANISKNHTVEPKTTSNNTTQMKLNNVPNIKVSDNIKEVKTNKTETSKIKFTPEELKKAIIYSEILKPLDF